MKFVLVLTAFFSAGFFVLTEIAMLLFATAHLEYTFYYGGFGLMCMLLLLIPAKNSNPGLNKVTTVLKVLSWVLFGISCILMMLTMWWKMYMGIV